MWSIQLLFFFLKVALVIQSLSGGSKFKGFFFFFFSYFSKDRFQGFLSLFLKIFLFFSSIFLKDIKILVQIAFHL